MFRFLLTTDNHLGYKERDARQALDSFITFEECLRAARCDFDVDAMLLAGDLFHENKPSLACMKQTMSIMRKYVMGDKPIDFALLSDPAVNFERHAVPCANFQDPNSNIALPIFAIHGNHDDPVGGTGSLDLLAHAGLLNYFGHVESLDSVVVRPILLRKGDTFVALYGFGNVRDERLHRCFELRKIQFVQPKEEPEKWFRILLLHQNRGVRAAGSKAGIHESMLYGFKFDLVIWGNEHEQLMVPQSSTNGEFDVIQPGSTVRTSLTANESNPKMFGILEVRGKDYRVSAYPLQSVRPVVRRVVELWKVAPTKTLDAVEEHLRGVADELIDEAQLLVRRIPPDVLQVHPNIRFPLMRIAVDYEDPEGAPYPQPNAGRFGQQFLDVIVNPEDCLKPYKRPPSARTTHLTGHDGRQHAGSAIPNAGVSVTDIRTKVTALFNANAAAACTLLSEPEVSTAVYSFVEKSEAAAIDAKIEELIRQSQMAMWKHLREVSEVDRPRVLQLALANKERVNEKFAKEHGEDPRPTPSAAAAIDSLLPLGAPLPRSHADLALVPEGDAGALTAAAAAAPESSGDAGVMRSPERQQHREQRVASREMAAAAAGAMIDVDGDDEVKEMAPAATVVGKGKNVGVKRGRKAAASGTSTGGPDAGGPRVGKARKEARPAAAPAGPQLMLSSSGGPGLSAAAHLTAKW